jgi:gas vesicle protein
MKNSHLIAFIGGAVAGGLIALLTAPRSGAETRKIIADKLKSGSALTKKELEELSEWIKEKLKNNDFIDEEIDNPQDNSDNVDSQSV